MIGPPGTGKTLLAKRLPTILPPLTPAESLETTRIYSAMGLLRAGEALMAIRPFRSPHHSVSDAGLVGGGSTPQPGEISLAHKGVLFLDEMPEFNRKTLEVLRQRLEEGCVTISRALRSTTFPAEFILVAAMNPCPCGYRSYSTNRNAAQDLHRLVFQNARVNQHIPNRLWNWDETTDGRFIRPSTASVGPAGRKTHLLQHRLIPGCGRR
jgi:predicted ATPase with chaperone activity